MNYEIEWAPNDYSPSYLFEVDENCNFVRLLKVFSMPTCYPDAKEINIDQSYVDYARSTLIDKYRKNIEYIAGSWEEWKKELTPKAITGDDNVS